MGWAAVATAMSGAAIHQIDARSDETHLILQIYVLESGTMCVGETIGGNKRTQSHLLSVQTDILVQITLPPPHCVLR